MILYLHFPSFLVLPQIYLQVINFFVIYTLQDFYF